MESNNLIENSNSTENELEVAASTSTNPGAGVITIDPNNPNIIYTDNINHLLIVGGDGDDTIEGGIEMIQFEARKPMIV